MVIRKKNNELFDLCDTISEQKNRLSKVKGRVPDSEWSVSYLVYKETSYSDIKSPTAIETKSRGTDL